MSEEAVNSPSHYNQTELECIDAIRYALGDEGFVAYCKGNALKYTWRAGHKTDSAEDLKKAAWYCRMASGDDPRKDPGYLVAVGPETPVVEATPGLIYDPATVWGGEEAIERSMSTRLSTHNHPGKAAVGQLGADIADQTGRERPDGEAKIVYKSCACCLDLDAMCNG